MKRVLQILTVLILSTNCLSAQWTIDSISMGPGYSSNIFYALGSGTNVQKTVSSSDWHMAFSMNALDSASVMANQKGSLADFTKVYNIHQPISAWNTATLGDTATADLLYNGVQGWYEGAFNQIPNTSAFNYGWGTYNIVTHKIKGDSMFIVKKGNEFYKFAIDSLNPLTYDWYFRVEKFSASLPPNVSYVVSRSSGYSNRLFAYFSLDSTQAHDREPDVKTWDMQFITYPAYVQAGPNSSYRGVTGVLHNRGRAVAEARNIEVDAAMTAFAPAIAQPHTGGPAWVAGWEGTPYTEIGYDWKNFNLGTFQYDIPDSLTYFISALNDTVYQMQFLEFPGGTTGNIKFRTRPMGPSPLAVSEIEAFSKASMYPNPAQNEVNFLFNAAKNTEATLAITALNGRTVYRANRKVNAGLNAWQLNTSNLTTGHYVITLSNAEGISTQKMTISR